MNSTIKRLLSTLLAPTLLLAAAPLAAAPCAVSEEPDFGGLPRLLVTGPISKQILKITATFNLSTTVELDCNADGDTSDPGDVQATLGRFATFDVSLGGSDTITFEIDEGPQLFGAVVNPQITLGPGTNSVTLALGGPGPVDFLQGTLLVEVFGGSGADTLTVTTPNVNFGTRFSLLADLGAGNDVVTVNQGGGGSTGSVQGADFRVAVNLGPGNNAFHFGQQTGSPGAFTMGSPFSVSVEGGSGRDSVTLALNGSFWDEAAEFTADLGAGNDTFSASLDLATFEVRNALPAPQRAALHIEVEGGPGANNLAVTRNGTATANVPTLSGHALLDVRLKGGAGADAISVDLDGNLFEGMSDGTLRVRLDGGAGNDTLSLLESTGAATSFPPVHDVIVTGGIGNDTINVDWDSVGFTDPASYGPHGRMLIDGMTGTDTCTLAGANLATRRGCEL